VERPGDICDQHACRNEPLRSDVSQRESTVGRIVVLLRALFLQGAIEQEVMPHVASAEKANRAAVQQTVQPVSEQFSRDAGTCDTSDNGGDRCHSVPLSELIAVQRGRNPPIAIETAVLPPSGSFH